jgi:E3 ubiquitin ligase
VFAHTASFISSSDSGGFWLVLIALLGTVGGISLFLKGFRMLQYKRLILNTPFSMIRSASIGLVELTGMPNGPQTIAAPITGEPCFYYRAQAWQWVDSGREKKWQLAVDESVSVPFFLEDATGKVLVNPQGADLDVHRNFSDEMSTSRFGIGSPIPEHIRRFVAERGLLAADKIRLEERVIKPGYPLFVFGTLGENRGQTSWIPMPHTTGARVSFNSGPARSLNFKFSLGASDSDIAMKLLEQAAGNNNVRIVTSTTTTTGPVVLPDSVLHELNRIGVPLPVSVVPESSQPAPGVIEPVTSSRIAVATHNPPTASSPNSAPSAEKQATAPSLPTKSSFDSHSPVAICKGERGDPFTISSQSQREVVQALGRKSTLYIWCSPVFTLACIYFLLVYWGWL